MVLLARDARAGGRDPAWPEELIVIQSARAQLASWLRPVRAPLDGGPEQGQAR
jgi:hypothetical protein